QPRQLRLSSSIDRGLPPVCDFVGELSEICFELGTENAVESRGAQMRVVQSSIQPASAQSRLRVLRPYDRRPFEREPRSGMHRHIENDQPRFAKRALFKRLARKIAAHNGVSALAQPGRRRRKPEWLAAQFIRGEQQNFHVWHSITRG